MSTAERRSRYNARLSVTDEDGVRRMETKNTFNTLIHSMLDLARPERLVQEYQQIMALLTALHPSPERVFSIGLGGGDLARFHLRRYPGARIVSAEVDPDVVDLAREYFSLDHPRHEVRVGDGRSVLQEDGGRYDVIWIDVFTPHVAVPEEFTQAEFVDDVRRHLAPGGLCVANMFFGAEELRDPVLREYRREQPAALYVISPSGWNTVIAAGEGVEPARVIDVYRRWRAEGTIGVEWPEGIEASVRAISAVGDTE